MYLEKELVELVSSNQGQVVSRSFRVCKRWISPGKGYVTHINTGMERQPRWMNTAMTFGYEEHSAKFKPLREVPTPAAPLKL